MFRLTWFGRFAPCLKYGRFQDIVQSLETWPKVNAGARWDTPKITGCVAGTITRTARRETMMHVQGPIILDRINTYLGARHDPVIDRIRLRQGCIDTAPDGGQA